MTSANSATMRRDPRSAEPRDRSRSSGLRALLRGNALGDQMSRLPISRKRPVGASAAHARRDEVAGQRVQHDVHALAAR